MSRFYAFLSRLIPIEEEVEGILVGLADDLLEKEVYNQVSSRTEPLVANIFREAFLSDFLADFSGDISVDLDTFLSSVADHLINTSVLTFLSEEKVRWALGAEELRGALQKIEFRED